MTALQADRPFVVVTGPPAVGHPAVTAVTAVPDERVEHHLRWRDGATNRHLLLLAAVLRTARELAECIRVEGHDAPCRCCPSTAGEWQACGERAAAVVADLAGIAWTLDGLVAAAEGETVPVGPSFRPDGDSHAADLHALAALADRLLD